MTIDRDALLEETNNLQDKQYITFRDMLVDQYKETGSATCMSDVLGISRSSIYGWLKECKVPTRPPYSFPPIDRDALLAETNNLQNKNYPTFRDMLIDQYKEPGSPIRMSDVLGISCSTIFYWLKEHNILTRIGSGRIPIDRDALLEETNNLQNKNYPTFRDMLIDQYKITGSTWRMEAVLGISHVTILKWLKENKIPIQPRGGASVVIPRFKSIPESEMKNMSVLEIASRCECKLDTVRSLLRRFNREYRRLQRGRPKGSMSEINHPADVHGVSI